MGFGLRSVDCSAEQNSLQANDGLWLGLRIHPYGIFGKNQNIAIHKMARMNYKY